MGEVNGESSPHFWVYRPQNRHNSVFSKPRMLQAVCGHQLVGRSLEKGIDQ